MDDNELSDERLDRPGVICENLIRIRTIRNDNIVGSSYQESRLLSVAIEHELTDGISG